MSEPSRFLLRHGTPLGLRGGVARPSPHMVSDRLSGISSLTPTVFQDQLEMDYAQEQGGSWGRGPMAEAGAPRG